MRGLHRLQAFAGHAASVTSCRASSDCRYMEIGVEDVRPIGSCIAGIGPVTTRWLETYTVLSGLYRHAIGRGFTTMSPLPTSIASSPAFEAYVYTVMSLSDCWSHRHSAKCLVADACMSMRTMLLLVRHGRAHRRSALAHFARCRLGDCLITVCDSKFFETRSSRSFLVWGWL